MQTPLLFFQHDQLDLSPGPQCNAATGCKSIVRASDMNDSRVDALSFIKTLKSLETSDRDQPFPSVETVEPAGSTLGQSAEEECSVPACLFGGDLDHPICSANDMDTGAIFTGKVEKTTVLETLAPDAQKNSKAAAGAIFSAGASSFSVESKDGLSELVTTDDRTTKETVTPVQSRATVPHTHLVPNTPNTEQPPGDNISVLRHPELNSGVKESPFHLPVPNGTEPVESGSAGKEYASDSGRIKSEPAGRNSSVNWLNKTDLKNPLGDGTVIKSASIPTESVTGGSATKQSETVLNAPPEGSAAIKSNFTAAESVTAEMATQQSETVLNSATGDKAAAKTMLAPTLSAGADSSIKKEKEHNTNGENLRLKETRSGGDEIRTKSGNRYHQSEPYSYLIRPQERSGNKSPFQGEFSHIQKEATLTGVDGKPAEEQILVGRGINQVGQTAESPEETARPDRPDRPQVLNQLVKNAVIQLKNGRSEVRIDLKPEILGRVRMLVSTENQQVTLRILTEYHAVKEIIDSSIGQLKSDLQNQGLAVDKLEVSVSGDSKQFDQRPGFADRPASPDQGKGNDRKDNRPADAETVPAEQTISGSSRDDGVDFFA